MEWRHGVEWSQIFKVFCHPSSSIFYHWMTNSDGVEWVIGVRFWRGKSRLKLGQSQTIFEPRHEKKTAFCTCENKDADQLCSKHYGSAPCFRYMDSAIPLLPKSEITSLQTSVAVQPSLCQTWSETPKTVFLTTRLILWCIKKCQIHSAGVSVNSFHNSG